MSSSKENEITHVKFLPLKLMLTDQSKPTEFLRPMFGNSPLLDASLKCGVERSSCFNGRSIGELSLNGKDVSRVLFMTPSPYSASKAASDHLVRAYASTHGLNITISNASNNLDHTVMLRNSFKGNTKSY